MKLKLIRSLLIASDQSDLKWDKPSNPWITPRATNQCNSHLYPYRGACVENEIELLLVASNEDRGKYLHIEIVKEFLLNNELLLLL